MLSILVGSTNPNKISGAKKAFLHYFSNINVTGEKSKSNVSDQPIGLNEMLLGAQNRAYNLFKKHKQLYDFYVGLESGILFLQDFIMVGTITYIIEAKTGINSIGISPFIRLPDSVKQDIKHGKELAYFAEKITETHDVRSKQGISGFLTKGKLPREDFNYLTVLTALARFIRKEVY